MENLNLDHIIRCPYCSTEYFPAEIFMPKSFLGTAFHINEELYLGEDMELVEKYTCDRCENIFEVTADVKFTVNKTVFGNFNEDFIQK